MTSLCKNEDHSRDSLNYFAEDNMFVSENDDSVSDTD
jgi:hypothetical protein